VLKIYFVLVLGVSARTPISGGKGTQNITSGGKGTQNMQNIDLMLDLAVKFGTKVHLGLKQKIIFLSATWWPTACFQEVYLSPESGNLLFD
jgi:hypothetical protein